MSITWLPISHRKNISQPNIRFEEPNGQSYGGYCDNLGIVIVYNNDLKHEASIIAHEYRHWIQNELGMFRTVPIIVPNMSMKYDTMIRWYFNTSQREYDALRYQNKHAKSETSEYWMYLTHA